MGVVPHEVNVDVIRLDPAIDAIVPPNPKLWKLAEGFKFTEGPIWVADRRRRPSAVLRSQQQHDLQLSGRCARCVQNAERVCRTRTSPSMASPDPTA